MKKLMIAAAAVMLGIAANAASYKWTEGGITAFGEKEYNDMYAGKVYLIDTATYTREQFVNAYLAGTSTFDTLVSTAFNWQMNDGWDATSAKSGTITSGNVFFDSSDHATGTKVSLFQVAYDEANKALFVSDLKEVLELSPNGDNPFAFDNDAAAAGTIFDGANSYQGSGWYTAVPEPTSGLLLLLGVAGLALRRRRA